MRRYNSWNKVDEGVFEAVTNCTLLKLSIVPIIDFLVSNVDAKSAHEKNASRHWIHFSHDIDFGGLVSIQNLFKPLMCRLHGYFGALCQVFKLAFVEGGRHGFPCIFPILSRLGKKYRLACQAVGCVLRERMLIKELVLRSVEIGDNSRVADHQHTSLWGICDWSCQAISIHYTV